MHKVLTIAASDSGGGSGIQADLKTILSLGGYGMSVVTALTAQNTIAYRGMLAVDPDFVGAQLDSVLGDIGAECVKTGALIDEDIVGVVAKKIRTYPVKQLVVDPVLRAESGTDLLTPAGMQAMSSTSFPSLTS